MTTTKETEPFEMKDAVRQSFVDSIINALNTKAEAGYGYGWHLVNLDHDKNGTATMVFQSPTPLRQWHRGKEWQGPHYVKVTVDAQTFTRAER